MYRVPRKEERERVNHAQTQRKANPNVWATMTVEWLPRGARFHILAASGGGADFGEQARNRGQEIIAAAHFLTLGRDVGTLTPGDFPLGAFGTHIAALKEKLDEQGL